MEWGKRNQSGRWQPRSKPRNYDRAPRNYQRPSNQNGSWQNSFLQWEKKFCTTVCLVPWKKICEAKDLIDYYPKIAEWNDSAGEEAFHNTKARYWANYNHLPCPVPLPDPDMYIDVVDYDVVIDPQLMEDLYEKHPPVPNVDDIHVPNIDEIKPTGWGDEEDELIDFIQLMQIKSSGWGGGKKDEIPTVCSSGQSIKTQPMTMVHLSNTKNSTNDITFNDPYLPKTSEAMNNRPDESWQHRKCRDDGYRRGQGRDRGSQFGPNPTDKWGNQGRRKGNYHNNKNKSRGKLMSTCGPMNYYGDRLQW